MIFYFKGLFSRIGVDKPILFTSFTSILSSIGGIFTILLIVKFLSLTEQGFFYTFSSLVAIQAFFEMGLNGVIVQFVAHDFSSLKWTNSGRFEGDLKNISRLASLLRFSIYWYSIFSLLLFIVLILTGFHFFNTYSNHSITVNWKVPWILLSLSTVTSLMLSPFIAFIQGLGLIKEVAKLQFCQLFVRLITLWLGLVLGFKLFVLGISGLFGLLLLIGYFIYKFRKIFKFIWSSEISNRISYRNEIFPFQWKIAISWISGYFIFQLFNPVLFAVSGPIVAGQMGMTITAFNGILALSTSWISTKIPKFSNLIALKKYTDLDFLFNKTIRQSALVNLFGLGSFLFILIGLDYFGVILDGIYFRNRFLDYLPLIAMMLSVFANNWVYGLGTYLRCHKEEPLMPISVATAVLNCLSIYFLANRFGLNGITFGYCFIVISLLPWAIFVFNKHKKNWHTSNNY